MSAASRRLGTGLLLLVLPALTVVAAEYHRAARGPFYSGPNQDPSYFYLLGSLQLARYGTTALYHHPGLPGQALGAAVLAGCYLSAGQQDDLTRDVLTRPELYLRILQLTTLAAVASALAIAGFVVRRLGDPVAALLLQTSPFIGAASLVRLSQVGPESTAVLATVALSLAVWRFAAVTPVDERGSAIVFGAITAFLCTTRISAVPFVLVPLLLLRSWRGRLFFAGATAVCSGLTLLLIAGYWRDFLDRILLLSRRTGAWGSQPKSVLDLGLYTEGLGSIFQRHHTFFAVLALALAVWLWHRRRRRAAGVHGLFHRALGCVLLAQAAQVLLVSKTPTDRYLVPATVLCGLDLALAWVLLTGGTGWGRDRRAIAAVLLLVFPVAMEMPRHRAELYRLIRGVEGRRTIAAEIAKLPADCTVAEFYRASSLPSALHLGRRVRPTAFAEELTELYPQELFYNYRRRGFEDFAGPIPAAEVAREHPCLALHGHFRSDLAPLVLRLSPVETLYRVTSLAAVVGPKTTEPELPPGAVSPTSRRCASTTAVSRSK